MKTLIIILAGMYILFGGFICLCLVVFITYLIGGLVRETEVLKEVDRFIREGKKRVEMKILIVTLGILAVWVSYHLACLIAEAMY